MIGLDLKVFRWFDEALIGAAADKDRIKALRNAGALVRTIAKRSMRRAPKRAGRKGSPAGSPPYSRIGTLKRLIVFAYDTTRDEVVIGPIGFGGPVPSLHEYGGVGEPNANGTPPVFKPRPYMNPALEAVLPQVPGMLHEQMRV